MKSGATVITKSYNICSLSISQGYFYAASVHFMVCPFPSRRQRTQGKVSLPVCARLPPSLCLFLSSSLFLRFFFAKGVVSQCLLPGCFAISLSFPLLPHFLRAYAFVFRLSLLSVLGAHFHFSRFAFLLLPRDAAVMSMPSPPRLTTAVVGGGGQMGRLISAELALAGHLVIMQGPNLDELNAGEMDENARPGMG